MPNRVCLVCLVGLCALLAPSARGAQKADGALEPASAAAGEDLYNLGLSDTESPGADEPPVIASGTVLKLSAPDVIRLTAKCSPAIKSAYERKAAEEARYRFFIVSRESFSYGTGLDFNYLRVHDYDDRSVSRELTPKVFAKKEFYNTASAELSVGYDLNRSPDDSSGNAVLSGGVRFPLFASREALERSNEKIYEQNKVNDAALGYYQQIRDQIQEALSEFSYAARCQESLRNQTEYISDLTGLLDVVASTKGRDAAGDAVKVEATLASTKAQRGSDLGEFEVAKERVKMRVGIPFETSIVIEEQAFDPFGDESREQLEKVALGTDEEIKTLLNSVVSSQAELLLARKGKWDTSLLIEARREFLGNGDDAGDVAYGVTTGVLVTHIDNRISRTLEEIALASIRGYKNDLVKRRREIHTNTASAYSTLVSQTKLVSAREANLPRYEKNYNEGVALYKSGAITIDELIKKRQDLYGEREEIAWSRHNGCDAVAELLASTGRYERFLDAPGRQGPASGAGAPVESTDNRGQHPAETRPADAPPAATAPASR